MPCRMKHQHSAANGFSNCEEQTYTKRIEICARAGSVVGESLDTVDLAHGDAFDFVSDVRHRGIYTARN